MAAIRDIIARLIQLRGQGIHLSLLAVCPNSEAVLEAAVIAATRFQAPMLLAATLNQVDRDGGYTGWTPAQFVQQMQHYAEKYHCHNHLYPCLDHGGQWLKDTQAEYSYAETHQELKASLTAVIQAGYRLLHLDPTRDRRISGVLPVELIVERSLELIRYAERERQRLHLPPLDYEVGTEEVHGGLANLHHFRVFLDLLHKKLTEENLPFPTFVVAQVGTDLHTTTFDRTTAQQLYTHAAPYGCLIKGHYSDFVTNPADYPQVGMGGANVGPEFATIEYEALCDLENQEKQLAPAQGSHFSETLLQAVDQSNRWQKWLLPQEQGRPLRDLPPDRRDWLVKTGARYVWTDPAVIAARQQLYHHLRPALPDPHQVVVERIVSAIEKYLRAFNLIDSLGYFG